METQTEEVVEESTADNLIDRTTLCLPHLRKDVVVHRGDEGFKDILRLYCPSAESNASERLVELKSKLRAASTHEFWAILMEGVCDILGAQCGFVAKRMLVDDQDSAVEMPALGEPGSCLMGVALYINNGADVKRLYRDYRYHAYGTPCAQMKHDKVFIIPERMNEFIRNSPNALPWKQSEAYIGLPLFAEGKCIGHFGVLWSSEGASKKMLSWPFIEMFMHSLEDQILQRILEGRGFVKEVAPPESRPAKVIPLAAITASQSLKPYARSLSHELRTPMQGVVGMLDIMYSTVVDAIATQQSDRARSVFEELKNHIEVVQDSSRRAVEAADNVVYAYDLNMQMPEVSLTSMESKERSAEATFSLETPGLDLELLISPSSKKRERNEEMDFRIGPQLKRMFTMTESEIVATYYSDETNTMSGGLTIAATETATSTAPPSEFDWAAEKENYDTKQKTPFTPVLQGPNLRRIITRDFMKRLVQEALRHGHPASEIHNDTELGEIIEFRTLGPRGEIQDRTIFLEIDSDVPESLVTEEQQLQFALQKLIDNAIKFTEYGLITITVKIDKNSHVEIRIVDTGCGISEESQSNLFKPHFQEDASISRAKDGLGLSLFNAKAHIRKNLGGDVTLERSATEGPSKGSEFMIRLPMSTFDAGKPQQSLLPSPPIAAEPSEIGLSSKTGPISMSVLSSPGIRYRQSLATRSPRKQSAFNPNLAAEYPLNILIAEDNAINRNVAIGTLNKLGYKAANVTVAFDGLEAVNQYKASLDRPPSNRFNCILMDIWMPNMDGYEATTKIMELARESGETLKIIAVTADVTEEATQRAKSSGMQGFLAKPYKVLDIEHMIGEHFQPCCCSDTAS